MALSRKTARAGSALSGNRRVACDLADNDTFVVSQAELTSFAWVERDELTQYAPDPSFHPTVQQHLDAILDGGTS